MYPIETLHQLFATKNIARISFTYTNKKGETAIYVVDTNVSYGDAKKSDTLVVESVLNNKYKQQLLALEFGIDVDTVEIYITKIYTSLTKISESSIAQSNSYTRLCDGVRIHIETSKLLVWGFIANKTFISDVVESKTSLIDKIKVAIGLITPKFRQFEIQTITDFQIVDNTLIL